jgi:hypothetical protein
MNRRQRKRQGKREKAKARDAHLDITLTTPKANEQEPTGEREQKQSNSDSLDYIPRWLRFKKWVGRVTFAEICSIFLGVAVALATIYYSVYARRQWEVLKRQTDDTETMEAARLTFDDFHGDIVPVSPPGFVR